MKNYSTWRKLLINNRGIALYLTMMILTAMLVVALGSAVLVMQGVLMSRTQTNSSRAYFAAEAGAERILWEVRKKSAALNTCNSGDYIAFTNNTSDDTKASCGNTEVDYYFDPSTYYFVQILSSDPTWTFRATGNSFDVRRTVEVSF